MTTINVQDETGRSGQLANDMHAFLTKAAPIVERVTQLYLPHTTTVKLLTVSDLAMNRAAFIRRQVERDTTGVDLSASERKKAAALPGAAARSTGTTWAVDAAVLGANTVGWPSTLIVPEGLAHQGLLSDSDGLCEFLVRVLAEQAQVEACRGTLVPSGAWPPVPRCRNPVAQLSAGHAWWAGRRATPLVVGKSLAHIRRQPSWTYRRQATLMLLATRGQRGRLLRRSAAFVDRVITSIGAERFNRVWTAHDLVPTLDELGQPERWLRRLPA